MTHGTAESRPSQPFRSPSKRVTSLDQALQSFQSMLMVGESVQYQCHVNVGFWIWICLVEVRSLVSHMCLLLVEKAATAIAAMAVSTVVTEASPFIPVAGVFIHGCARESGVREALLMCSEVS